MKGHSHDPQGTPPHLHGAVDASLLIAQRGLWAVRWSFWGLLATACLQMVIAGLSGSAALLADTIHNLGDAATAVPLWFAFRLARWKPTQRFTYGYGRLEDLAGGVIVWVMLASGILAAWTSVERIAHPAPIRAIPLVVIAALIGFAGNEAVAGLRIRVGKAIGSAALVADGYHARADGLTSLAVLAGAAGVSLGLPWIDPLVGLGISGFIFKMVWETGEGVFSRLLDRVEPDVIEEIAHAASHVPEIHTVGEARVRWAGHRLYAEMTIVVDPHLSVEKGHALAQEMHHQLLHHLPYLSNVTIHVDPANAAGEGAHAAAHRHEHKPLYAH